MWIKYKKKKPLDLSIIPNQTKNLVKWNKNQKVNINIHTKKKKKKKKKNYDTLIFTSSKVPSSLLILPPKSDV